MPDFRFLAVIVVKAANQFIFISPFPRLSSFFIYFNICGYFLGGCIDHCNLHNRYWYNILNIKTGSETCGGNGGNGGNGGPGGPAGFLAIDGPTDVKPQNTRLSSQGKYIPHFPEKLFQDVCAPFFHQIRLH